MFVLPAQPIVLNSAFIIPDIFQFIFVKIGFEAVLRKNYLALAPVTGLDYIRTGPFKIVNLRFDFFIIAGSPGEKNC
jgi:hypothetical protein